MLHHGFIKQHPELRLTLPFSLPMDAHLVLSAQGVRMVSGSPTLKPKKRGGIWSLMQETYLEYPSFVFLLSHGQWQKGGTWSRPVEG